MGLPTAFNSQAAGNLDATIQYTLTGEGGGMYHVRIKDGKCTAHRGPSVDAELSINSPAKVWKAISKGEIPGLQSYMDGKYQWSGDLNIIMILDNLFEKTGAQNSPAYGTHTRKGEEETITDKSTLNCHDIIAGMPTVFDAGAAGDLIADIQFDISGKEWILSSAYRTGNLFIFGGRSELPIPYDPHPLRSLAGCQPWRNRWADRLNAGEIYR